MSQTLAEKMAAIRSLLPLVFAHRDYDPHGLKVRRAEWVSEPSHLDPPPLPTPTWTLDCDGHCHTCRAADPDVKCPPEEKWLREYEKLRARYRIGDLEKAVVALRLDDLNAAQAVWVVFVEPWPGALLDPERPELGARTEAISEMARNLRAAYAQKGLGWLAEKLEGDVRGEGDRGPTKLQQCADLMAEGITSTVEISRRLGVGTSYVRKLKRAIRGRPQSALSAVG